MISSPGRRQVILLVIAGMVVVSGLVAVSGLAAVDGLSLIQQESPTQPLSDAPPPKQQVDLAAGDWTPPTSGPAWRLALANPANTNYLDTTGPTSPITTRWTLALDDKAQNWFTTSPVVANGALFVGVRHKQKGGDSRSNLYAVDAWTGEENWRFTPPSTESRNAVSDVAVFRDTVYIGTRNNKVYALKAATGEVRWALETDGGVSGLTVANRTLYVTSKGSSGSDVPDGKIYAMRALTGEERWRFTSPGAPAGPFKGPPAVVDGTVYVSERYGRIFALDAQTGTERWRVRVDEDRDRISLPAVANGLVYVADNALGKKPNNTLFALDAKTGDQRWSYQGSGKVTAPPAVANDTVYVGVKDDGTYALNAETGEERWHIDSTSGRPALVNGLAYVRRGENLYVLDPATGEERARFTFEESKASFASGLAVLNGSLYAGVGVNHQAFRYYDSTELHALGTPEFDYANLSVTPQNVDPGEPVTATVTVSNTGTGPGAFNATLTVDGDVVNATTGRLDAGASRTVTFTHVFEGDGAYTVGISGLTRNIGVGAATPAPSPTPTPTPTVTKTPIKGDETRTATVTPESTPGLGVSVGVAAVALVAGLVGLRKRR